MWIWTTFLALSAVALSPTPREISVDEDDHFYLRPDTMVVLSDEFVPGREALLAPVAEVLGGRPQVAPASQVDKAPTAFYVATVAHPGALEKRKLRRFVPDDYPLPPSGYQLSVGKQGIVLVGADETGLWYGLHAVASLVGEYGANLPYLEVRDWPTLAVRAVYTKTLPTSRELDRLAGLRATHLFIQSDDFYELTGVRAEAWRQAFDNVRAAHMEPIPVFSTLDGMETILRDYPHLIEGRGITEQIVLFGAESKPLGYPNIIAIDSKEIEVTVSGVPCTLGEDYWLEGPAIQAPFHPDGPRWRIWRELEGAIPHGGTVTVRYSIATADSSSLAFAEPEAWHWLEERIERLVTTLQPRYIHFDHGSIGRFNTDIRSERSNMSNSERFVQSLSLLNIMLNDADERVTPMIWADLLNPFQSATTYGLDDVGGEIPERIHTLGRVHIESTDEARVRLAQLGPLLDSPLIVGVDGSMGAVQMLVQSLVDRGAEAGGLIALSEDPESIEDVLAAAWTGAADGGIWVRGLNTYFNANFTSPGHKELQTALVRYLNGKTLAGERPEGVYGAYHDFVEQNEELLESDADGATAVDSMLSILTTYLTLEEAFSREGDDGTVRKLQRLVETIQAQDPAAAPERYQRILDTIEGQKLFVPASILFQEDVRYFCPGRFESTLYEVPIIPVYEDQQGQVMATLDLLRGQAPVRRIDFEGLGIDTLQLDAQGAQGTYGGVQQWAGSRAQSEVRGPLLIKDPMAADGLRMTATGTRTPLVLRDVRLFAEKSAPVMNAHYAVQAPAMVPRFEGRSWSDAPQGDSFLQRGDVRGFAEAPTALRVTHTREALYFGIEASETRPDAIIADLATRDASLWEQESVELWLQRKGRAPLRLIVSPMGTQYDSEAYDGGWNGDWSAVAERNDHGWSAVVRVPTELVGPFRRGDTLLMNVVRNRLGVRQEESAWAHEYGAQPDLQWGVVRFP